MNYLERIISSRMRSGTEEPEFLEESMPISENAEKTLPPTSIRTSGYLSSRRTSRTSMRSSGYHTSRVTSGYPSVRTSGRTSMRTSGKTSGRSYTSHSSRFTSYTSGRFNTRTSFLTSQQYFGSSHPDHPIDEPFDPSLLQAIPTCSADLLGYGLHLIDE